MTHEEALRQQHDAPKPAGVKSMTLKVLLPEINGNQWIMMKQVLESQLELTPEQEQLLEKLVG